MKKDVQEFNINSKENIKNLIYKIRGENVIFDTDVATLYNYNMRDFNRIIKRNKERFSKDVYFKLTQDEYINLMSKYVKDNEGRKYKDEFVPYAFTELGIHILVMTLNKKRDVQTNINIMDAFAEKNNNVQILRKIYEIEKLANELSKRYEELINVMNE